MKKPDKLFIPLIAIGVVLFAGYEGFGWNKFIQDFVIDDLASKNFLPEDPAKEEVAKEAWQVVEEYIAYAKAHDLDGIKRLSYKISDTCADESKREECYGLMDSVYVILSQFKLEDFENVLWDEHRITLFTDYFEGTRVAIYFIRDIENALKIKGMRFCFGDESKPDECSTL